jgi:hypothetical protein
MATKPKFILNLDGKNVEEIHVNPEFNFTSKKKIEEWLLSNGKFNIEWRYGYIVKFKELDVVSRFVDHNNDTIKIDL